MRVDVVKSVSCNLRVSSLAKPMLIYLNTVRSLNVCNVVKFVRSTHHIRRANHVISNHRQAFYPKANVLSSSRTKSSPSYSTSNPRFSPLATSSRNLQHISLSAKLCIFVMMLFNVALLNRSIQNILVFDILMDLILLLLVYLRFYSSMSDRPSFYFKQHKQLLKPSFDCFLTCSTIKVTCNININNFGVHLKVFTLLSVYILLYLTNKLFVDVAYKTLISGKYLYKSCKTLSVLVHFLLFTNYLTYLSARMVLSAVLKFANFISSLFFTSLTSRIFIALLFLTRTHTIIFKEPYIKYLGGGPGGFLWGSWNILGKYWWAMKYFVKFLIGHKIFSYVLFS